MTQNRRIEQNIVATYGIPERRELRSRRGVRSLDMLAIGLFCGRLMLMGAVV